MKLRSKSPFGRRRNVRDLLDDVRKAGGDVILNTSTSSENITVGMLDTSADSNSILQNSILSTPTSRRKYFVDDSRRNWNQSQYERHSKNLEDTRDSESEQRRNLIESEVAKQKKTAELVQKTRQLVNGRKEKKEAKSALAVDRSNTTTPTSLSRSTASQQQKSRRFSRRKSMGKQQQQQQQVVEVKKLVKESPRKSRSRSPFRRWRKAEDLVTDIRRKEQGVPPHTPSTAASSVPVRSAAGSPHAASAATSAPSTFSSPSAPSRAQSPEQSRRSRSKSPFRRFFKSGELIKQVNLVEQDFAFELQRKSSQQVLESGRSPVSPIHRRKKAKELIPDNRKDGAKEVEVVLASLSRSSAASLSPKASKISPAASPDKQPAVARAASSEEALQERRSFRNPFSRTVTPSAMVQSKAKQQAAAVAAAAVVSGYETPQRRSSLLWGKKQENSAAPLKEENKSPQSAQRFIPRTITKRNRSTVSELSSPVFSGGRCRSISDDSAAKVKKALSKVQRNLGPDTRSIKSVKTVMETLLEVSDKLESEADRETLRNALSRLQISADSDGSSRSSADSESSPSDTRLGEDETEFDESYDLEFESVDDASSYTRWEKMGRVTVKSILALIGLPYLWNSPETVVEEDDEDSTTTSSTNASEKSKDETYDAPIDSSRQSASRSQIASKSKLVDDDDTLNLIMDDDEMLRELEELDHKMKLEKERATRKKIEAEREEKERQLEAEVAEKKKRSEEERNKESEKKKDATLKARLERRRKREIMISEQKARKAEALKKMKASGDARSRKEAEAEKQRKIVAQVEAEEFARQQEQAAKEAQEKKRIRLEEIKDAARRREAEERRKKIQLQKAVEATKRRKQAEEADQKKRRDEQAKVLLANAKAAKMRRAEFEQRRHATRSQLSLASSSGYSTDTDPCPFPKPPPQNFRSGNVSSFRPLREEEISSSAYSDTDFDSRLTSSIWSDDDDFSLESVDSSQFDVPPMKKGKGQRRGETVGQLSKYKRKYY